MKHEVRMAIVLLLATAAPASAKVMIEGLPSHRFSGGIEARMESATNIGGRPADTGAAADDFDNDDADDFDADDFGDEALEDLVDEADLDNEDLDEQDGVADEDGDGIDDALDGNTGPASRRDSDVRSALKATLGHTYVISPRVAWKTAALMQGDRIDDRSELERTSWAINSGPVFKLLKGFALQPSVTYAESAQEANRKLDTWIASLGASWKATTALKLSARYNYQDRSGVPAGSPDSEVDNLKLGGTYKFSKHDVVKLVFMPSIEDNSRATQDKDRYGFEAGYAHKFPHKFSAALKARYTSTEYDNVARDDDQYQYALGLRKGFAHGIYAGASIDYATRESSVAGKDFDNTSYIANVGWKF